MLFGAVSKLRLDPQGNPQVNTSIITLPPHTDFLDIHAKSFPLILKPDEIVDWINPNKPFSDFTPLLSMETFREPFRVSKVSSDFSEKVKGQTLGLPKN
jgi:putative SOS response-associated peptidase YedK